MIIIRDNGLFDSVFLTLIAIALGAMFIVLVFAEGPKLQVWLHRNDVRTVKTANYELLKKYTTDKKAHYVYKLSWEYSDKVEYADVRYESKSTGNGSHTFKRVGMIYSDTEPIPDNVNRYKLENVEKDKQKAERESERNDGPTFIPFFIPIR